MARVIWTPVAESDLDDILYYIAAADRRPVTGERIYYEIRDRVAQQVANRHQGQRHPHVPATWRYFRHKRWLIFYQPLDDGIEVMRVIDGSRDLPRHFE